jgi:hypothetical protein
MDDSRGITGLIFMFESIVLETGTFPSLQEETSNEKNIR